MIVTGFAEGIFDPGNPSRITRRERKTDAEADSTSRKRSDARAD
jgi:hypothetical protein